MTIDRTAIVHLVLLTVVCAALNVGASTAAKADTTRTDGGTTQVDTMAFADNGTASDNDRSSVAVEVADPGNDTAVLWRGFRHAWSYNHRFNRFGSWVDMKNCDGSSCEYEVGHSAASGTGEDVAATRDAYTELSAKGVAFHQDSITLELNGSEKRAGPIDQSFSENRTVTVPFQADTELENRDEYVALLNGMDVVSQGSAAKLIDFELNVSEVRTTSGGLEFDVEKNVKFDCDSFECDGLFGKGIQDIDYEIEVQYLVVAGDEGRFNVVRPDELTSSQDWEACDNNGIGPKNSDGYPHTVVDNGFPGNHMWCENMPRQPLDGGIIPGGSDLHHGNYWRTDRIHGKEAPSSAGNQPVESGYSVGAVGISGLSLNMPHESHFVQYDSVVGGSYDAAKGEYDVRALPFFKEWSSRPGMYTGARYSYGFEGSAEVSIQPVLLQIRDGCKRSFVSGGSVHWGGSDEVPTTPDAVTNETHEFDYGETWYGYGNARGNHCDQPDDHTTATWQFTQDVPGTSLRWDEVFPIRDGYPPSVPGTSTGSRIDLWNELRDARAVDGEEASVQDPTQLHGRPSDRFVTSDTDNRDQANLSEVNVTIHKGGQVTRTGDVRTWVTDPVDTESIDLDNVPGSIGLDVVVLEDHRTFFVGGEERLHISVENENASYELDSYLISVAAAKSEREEGRFWSREVPKSVRTGRVDDHSYALELVVSCPDQSCQPTYAIVPINIAVELDPFEFRDFHNTTEITAASPRDDRDHYAFELDRPTRVSNASLQGAGDLELSLYKGATPVRSTTGGTGLNTSTTDMTGRFHLVVTGDDVVDEYTLNLTTQYISQLYEENDAKPSAHDFSSELDVDPFRSEFDRKYGSNQRCGNDNDGSTGDARVGGGGAGDTGVESLFGCPRHNWVKQLSPSPGYSPEDPDWYRLSAKQGERVNVDIEGEDLGIELYEDGTLEESTAYATDDPSLSHIVSTDADVFINVTGASYNPTYNLTIQWVAATGQDRFELNDNESTAKLLVPGEGENVERFDDLALAGDDEDYFEVYLEDGDDLNATVDHRDTDFPVELELVRPDGTVVAGSAGGPGGPEQVASLVAQSDGEHYVRVASEDRAAMYYNLTVGTDKQSPVAISGPGFGFVVALLALLGSGLLAARRHR